MRELSKKTATAPQNWDAVERGNCPKRESLQKWLGEGAKGLFDSFGLPGLRVRPPGIEWKTGRNPKKGKNWAKK